MPEVVYLDLPTILLIHQDQILRYGGVPGVLNLGQIQAAVAMVEQAVFGVELHATIAAKAAAYWFHLCQAHGFRDGNKRVAAASMVAFLGLNGSWYNRSNQDLERVTLAIASGKSTKAMVVLEVEQSMGSLA